MEMQSIDFGSDVEDTPNPFQDESIRKLSLSVADDFTAVDDTTRIAAQSAYSMEPIKDAYKSKGKRKGSAKRKKEKQAEGELELKIKADELARKEKLLIEREKKLEAREEELRQDSRRMPKKNWPFTKYITVAHHDINKDIPKGKRSFCRRAYRIWMVTELALVMTFLCTFIIWCVGGEVITCLWGLIYLLAGTYGAWNWWYKMLYKSLQKARWTCWVRFWVFFSAHYCWTIISIIGIPKGGFGGILNILEEGKKLGSVVVISCIVNICLWGIVLLGNQVILKQAKTAYDKSGAAEEGKKEAAKYVAKAALENSDYIAKTALENSDSLV